MLFARRCCSKTHCWCMLAAVVGLLFLAGCQSQTTGPIPSAQVKLGFHLQSADLASLVDLVTLTMTYPDSSIVLTIPLDDNGEIHDTLVVPPADAIVFTLRALDNEGRLLYIGSQTRSVAPGQQVEINILLLPNPELLMLRAGPLFQSALLQTEEMISVYVDVHNVDSLFGAAFRIRYDTLVLRFSHAEEGDFVRGDPPVPTLAIVLKDTLNFVAYDVTRLNQTGVPRAGVSGSGRLATFFFSKRRVGSTALTIDPRTVSLTRPDANGSPVNRFASLALESATVEVR